MTEISSELLKILICPVSKKSLRYDRDNQELVSEEAGLAYPIRDGIPILLEDQARKIAKQNYIYKKVVTNENKITNNDNSGEKTA